jgi:hypothetical protein
MAHFAKLGVGNIILTVEVVSNDIAINRTRRCRFFKQSYMDTRDVWKQTSYNGNIRKNFAGIGYKYDQARDAFIAPKPFRILDIKRRLLVNGNHLLLILQMVKSLRME